VTCFDEILQINSQTLDLGIKSSVSPSVLLPLQRLAVGEVDHHIIARRFPSLYANGLGSVLEPDGQALLVQHPDTAVKLPASVIVVFFDHPASLRHRRIAFLRASFKGDLWLSTRLQFCLDLHLSPLTQPISILRLIFYNVLRWPFRDTFRLKILFFLKLAVDIPQYAILLYGN
jgi:hypothetical protein